jgi:hypothetical protein
LESRLQAAIVVDRGAIQTPSRSLRDASIDPDALWNPRAMLLREQFDDFPRGVEERVGIGFGNRLAALGRDGVHEAASGYESR